MSEKEVLKRGVYRYRQGIEACVDQLFRRPYHPTYIQFHSLSAATQADCLRTYYRYPDAERLRGELPHHLPSSAAVQIDRPTKGTTLMCLDNHVTLKLGKEEEDAGGGKGDLYAAVYSCTKAAIACLRSTSRTNSRIASWPWWSRGRVCSERG